MLRQVKPFVTQYKSGPRHRSRPAQFDPDDIFAGDEKKPVDISRTDAAEEQYEQALHAAESLFGTKEPSEPHDQSREHAESFFAKPAEPREPREPQRRILADLTAKDELAERIANAPRRGRKAGSTNRPKHRIPSEVLPARDLRLHQQLDQAALSVRTKNILADAGINYVGELVQLTEAGLRGLSDSILPRRVKEISDFLSIKGLRLNTSVTAWPPANLAPIVEPVEQAPAVEHPRPVLVKQVPRPVLKIKPSPPVTVPPQADLEQVRQLFSPKTAFRNRVKPGEKWKVRRHIRSR